MLERDLIQTRGFHNTTVDGKVAGFQFNIRLTYYRGIFLSQLRPWDITVDGERFDKRSVIWNLKGEDFSYEQMSREVDAHWGPEDTMTVKVPKNGGLKEGYHEIKAGYRFSSSYLPPQLQSHIDDEESDPLLSAMFGQLESTRKLLLVM